MGKEAVKEILEAFKPDKNTLNMLEALASYWESRAVMHEGIGKRWDDTPEGREQKIMDYGIAAGYRGPAEGLREAIASLSPTKEN